MLYITVPASVEVAVGDSALVKQRFRSQQQQSGLVTRHCKQVQQEAADTAVGYQGRCK